MKKILVVLILTISLSLFAQSLAFDNAQTQFSQTYNVLYPANFNPDEPNLQPDLFRIKISGDFPISAIMYCEMFWDGESVANATMIPHVPGQFPLEPIPSSEIINSNNSSNFQITQNFDDFLESIEDQVIDTGRI